MLQRLVVGSAFIALVGVAFAAELSLRFAVGGAGDRWELFSDVGEWMLHPSSVWQLRDGVLTVRVVRDGVALADAEGLAWAAALIDALDVFGAVQRGEVFSGVRGGLGQQQRRGNPAYDAVFPATVEFGSNHANWLLQGGVGNPGLDDYGYRVGLWRDTVLDGALLGSLHSELQASDAVWFESANEARLSVWRSEFAREVERVAGITGVAASGPQSLADVVSVASAAGVSPEVLQGVLDATVPGLHAGVYQSRAGVVQGSPFGRLQAGFERVGLGLSVVGLASRLTGDAFDVLALQLALNEDAERRLALIEGVVARQACDVGARLSDGALCEGVRLARVEFEALRESLWRGVASVFVTSDALVDYASLSTSIVGQVAGLAGSHPAAAAAVKGVAAKVGAGLYVVRTVASIMDEGVPLRRAFLVAHLNNLLLADDVIVDPAEVADAEVWARSVEAFALAQVLEFTYYSYLRSGYSGRFGDGTFLLHALTRALHGSGDVVRELERLEAQALTRIVSFEPLSVSVVLRAVPGDEVRSEGVGVSVSSSATDEYPALVAFSAGSMHSLTIDEDGSLWAWGNNEYGQLGDGTRVNRLQPVRVVGLSGVRSAAAGGAHSVALLEDGSVWAWGWNEGGQLGDGTTTDRLEPVRVVGLTGVESVAAGASHTLALRGDRSVWAWGDETLERIGDPSTSARSEPVLVSGLADAVHVVAGWGHSLALLGDGTVWTWGRNHWGQLGDGSAEDRWDPVRVSGLSGVMSVASFGGHSLAMLGDRSIWAWGWNKYGQLGDGTTTDRSMPVQVLGLSDVRGLAAGVAHSLAVRDDGSVWAWGNNEYWQLGDGTETSRLEPVLVGGVSGVWSIAAGELHSLAMRGDGGLWAWGWNEYGQLGDGSTTYRSEPASVAGLPRLRVVDVSEDGAGRELDRSDDTLTPADRVQLGTASAGETHTLAVRENGSVWAWGGSFAGQLGDGGTVGQRVPVRVAGLSGAVGVTAGWFHSFALLEDGTVWAWGLNHGGRLGDGSDVDRLEPVRVAGLSEVRIVVAGGHHSAAVREDGSVWTWGPNDYGQLGDGSNVDRFEPVRVVGLTNARSVAVGRFYTLALREDGSVWAWGANDSGQLGDGTMIDRSEPVRVVGLSGVVGIAAGQYHSAALLEDGTVWTWGANSGGQLGDGSTVGRMVPVRVVGVENAHTVAAGSSSTFAVLQDGGVLAWGANDWCQLGDGSNVDRAEPVPVVGLSGVVRVDAGRFHSVALRQDGSVWSWGADSHWQLGRGRVEACAVPDLVVGLTDVRLVGVPGGFVRHEDEGAVVDGTVPLPAFEVMPSYVSISNVRLSDSGVGVGSRLVSFDISWPESWRGPDRPSWVEAPDNWDAAWVFLKYRVDGGVWRHATLAESGHSVPPGAVVDVSSDRVGAFVSRATPGYGVFAANGVGLAWDMVADRVAAGASVEVLPFAIEMVFVPEGPFFLGSGGSSRGEFRAGGTSNSPFLVSGQSSIALGDGLGQLMWTEERGTGRPSGQTSPSFPTGYGAFYVMKTSLMQGEYVNFLNTLTQVQADARRYTDGGRRFAIVGESVGWYSTNRPFVAMNWMSWADGVAFADWAGLRPMTELEFEKAARGPREPAPDEFAWGSATITQATGLTGAGTVHEEPTPETSNANFPSRDSRMGVRIDGPVRAGSFALPGRSREQAGAGFYGALELSGNVWERVVTVGGAAGRTFSGAHGNGSLDSSGRADVSSWPSEINAPRSIGVGFAGYRGGFSLAGDEDVAFLRASDRSKAVLAIHESGREGRMFTYFIGWRGARSAP